MPFQRSEEALPWTDRSSFSRAQGRCAGSRGGLIHGMTRAAAPRDAGMMSNHPEGDRTTTRTLHGSDVPAPSHRYRCTGPVALVTRVLFVLMPSSRVSPAFVLTATRAVPAGPVNFELRNFPNLVTLHLWGLRGEWRSSCRAWSWKNGGAGRATPAYRSLRSSLIVSSGRRLVHAAPRAVRQPTWTRRAVLWIHREDWNASGGQKRIGD